MELSNKNNTPMKGNLLQIGVQKEVITPNDFISKESDEIITFIINHFHANVRKNFTKLTQNLLKIMAHHIHEYKELFWEVHDIFSQIRKIFEEHLIIEEELIFKPLKEFINGEISKDSERYADMVKTIDIAMNEHFTIGPLVKKLEELTDGYVAPKDACGSIKRLYMDLKEFQSEIFTHTQIENKILFPRFLD